MENTKIVMLNAKDPDEDCFIRICNSKNQEMRRRKRVERDRRMRRMRQMAKEAAVEICASADFALISSIL